MTLLLRSSKDFVGPDGQPSFPPDTVTTGIVLKLLIDQYGVLPPASRSRRCRAPAHQKP